MTFSFRPALLLTLLAAAPLVVAAQAARPVAKPTARPAAKPAAKPVAKPAAKAPAPAPAPAPAARPAPAPAPAARTTKTTKAAPAEGPFGVGTRVVNLGVGFGSRYSYGLGFLGGSSSVTPAFSLSYEQGIVAVGPGYIGVGGIVGYQGASYDFGGGDKWHYADVLVAARGAFHYPVSPQLDAYGGLNLGVRYLRSSYDDGLGISSASGDAYLASGIFLGARYFFTPSIGAFAELGYDQSFLKLGLAAKF